MNLRKIFRNPMSIWLNSLIKNYLIEKKNQNLHIGYMSHVENCNFGKYVYISEHDSIQNVSIGDFSYVGNKTSILNSRIGKFCSIANNVFIGPGKHPVNFVSLHPIFYRDNSRAGYTFTTELEYDEYGSVEIENDVWIGTNTIIMPGVKISNGAIIAAGAIVTKNIPPFAIAGGIPAKVIKFRFDDSTVKYLQEIKWWNRDPEYLKANYKYFHSIESFMERF
ncbi:MAG: CatB-related O-acetyltransferase [Candidatus Kapaibacterium sp.]